MPTEPAEIPVWADTETPATPSAGQQNAGWSTIPIPSYDTFNWLGKWTGRWVTWLKAWYVVEHDSDGHHKKIVYPAASPRQLVIPLGSYEKGGWFLGSASTVAAVNNDGATPPNTGMGAGAGTLSMLAKIPVGNGQDDTLGSPQWTIYKLHFTYKRVGTAGNTFTWSLLSQLADGTGAYVSVATGTLTSAAIARGNTGVINAIVDPDKRYYVRVVMVQGAGAVANEVVISNVDAECYRTRLE